MFEPAFSFIIQFVSFEISIVPLLLLLLMLWYFLYKSIFVETRKGKSDKHIGRHK